VFACEIAMLARFFALLLIGVAALTAIADEDSTPTTGEELAPETKKLHDLVENSIDDYELFADRDSDTPLKVQSVLRWRNVTRGQEGLALMAVWTLDGRPEAIASIFPWEAFLIHEFGSISRESKLVARTRAGGDVAWSPRELGVAFADLPGAPAPADSRVARLRQMKALAARFHATMTGWKADDSDREELRLLPRPLYRYDLKESSKKSHPGLLDGALFAFVQGTDPEVVLILEAIETGDVARWQFGLSRATSGGLEASLEDRIVWTAAKFPETSSSTKPHFNARRRIDLP
jgi:hypothetical protein